MKRRGLLQLLELDTEGFVQRYDSVSLKTTPFRSEDAPILHLSSSKLTKLTARVPKVTFGKSGDEEAKTRRISFSPSISLCLLAVGSNVEFQKFYVHEPRDYSRLRWVPNKVIVQHRLVPDAHLTEESWVLNPSLEVVCTGMIKVGKAIPKKYATFDYHDIETEERKEARAYFFHWSWLKAYHINFPPEEHSALLARLNEGKQIVTTRIHDEYNKYRSGDVLTTNLWSRPLKVQWVGIYTDIKRHPFLTELTAEQRQLIQKEKHYVVIWLVK